MEPKIAAKSWNHEIEGIISKRWQEQDTYKFSLDHQNPFVIDTPPPYPSGRPWHIGAAAHYVQIDMIARTARMMGYNVMFPLGIDRNGLPVEIYTEKKYNIRMRQTDRNKFLDLCSVALNDLESEMVLIMKRMGLSANFKEYYRTDSEEFRSLTQSTFIELWKRNQVYLANRPNNYCPDCGTTIADQEVMYEAIPTKLIYMHFKIQGTESTIIVASTRPELLFACQAIIINPKDERYLKLHGKSAVIPIFNREVKIIPHNTAKPEFGSGVVMVCSYGDQNDVQIFRELGLKEIVSINENGRTTSEAGSYANLRVNQARAKIIEDLRNTGILEKEENIMHRTPLCERSKTPVEIIPLQDFYLKQLDYVPSMRDLANKIEFYPKMHRQILLNWLDSIAIDWPISRRRFYGTEIPIWYCNNCMTPNLPEPGKYYRPWKEKPPFERCNKCGKADFTGEDRTFDTWMDSSITPLFITKYRRDQNLHSFTYPTQMRPQGKDIVRTWLHYTMLRCFQLTGQQPWFNVWIMGFGTDEKGEKMSKSKGNVIDPFPVINQYGADTFRFWCASESNLGYDFRCSEQRIVNAQKFLSKLWNIARFISSFDIGPDTPSDLASSDRWIMAELSKLIDECRIGFDNFNFFVPANAIREFTWNLFASHYMEMVKSRFYDNNDKLGQRSAVFALHKCLTTILLLLAPICPFITEELWTTIYSSKSIHLEPMPKSQHEYPQMTGYTKTILEFNSMVWNKKKETISEKTGKPLSLKDSIDISVPAELQLFKKDLEMMHNLKNNNISHLISE